MAEFEDELADMPLYPNKPSEQDPDELEVNKSEHNQINESPKVNKEDRSDMKN